MNASGKAAASAWVARHPVQWVGATTCGSNSRSASTVGGMLGSKTGVARWKPPTTACTRSIAGELAGVAHGIDQPGVAAAGDDDQTPVAQVGHQRLIVVHQGVGLPFPVTKGLLDGQPLLELRGALDLPGHQQVTVEQGRWLPFLDHPEAGGADLLQAGRG